MSSASYGEHLGDGIFANVWGDMTLASSKLEEDFDVFLSFFPRNL